MNPRFSPVLEKVGALGRGGGDAGSSPGATAVNGVA